MSIHEEPGMFVLNLGFWPYLRHADCTGTPWAKFTTDQ